MNATVSVVVTNSRDLRSLSYADLLSDAFESPSLNCKRSLIVSGPRTLTDGVQVGLRQHSNLQVSLWTSSLRDNQ